MSFVAGVGKTNVDLIYAGMPRVPAEGEELFAQDFSLQLGGGVPGTMVNLGRLGVPAKIGTYLGEDLFSKFAYEMFRENGVKPVDLPHGNGIPLNITTAVLTPRDRTFISYSDPVTITQEVLEKTYRLSTGAKIVQMQYGYLPVYEKLHAEGTVLVFDIGWDDEMGLEKYGPYLRVADYFTPNTKEALKITGAADPYAAAEKLSEYFEKVIVKLDQHGCLVQENGRQFLVKSIPEFRHKDSTGAGDAFLSGFLYGLYHDFPFRKCVLMGNITGGKCVTEIGCLTAFCTEKELLALAGKYAGYIDEKLK